MRINHRMLKQVAALGMLLMMGVSMSAEAGLFGFGGTSWKEEVLLHDGSKIIVERSVERGGRHELGQMPSISEQSLSFVLPSTKERITWEDHYSDDVGSSNFSPMLLEIFGDAAYVLSHPLNDLSYSKWGCPNPPYVIFKYQNKEWKRVPLQELPAEVKLPNLVISSPDDEAKNAIHGVLSAEMIKQANEGFRQPEYRTILREQVANTGMGCLVPIKGGGWGSPGGAKAPGGPFIIPSPASSSDKDKN